MYTKFFKRFLDIVLSGMAIVVLSPLLLLLAALVRPLANSEATT